MIEPKRRLVFDDPAHRAPSHALRLALASIVAAERDPRYEVDLETFFAPNERGRCRVCAAGALMAASLGWPDVDVRERDRYPKIPAEYIEPDATVLEFVDFVARGNEGSSEEPIINFMNDESVEKYVKDLDAAFDTGITGGVLRDLADGPLSDAVDYEASPTDYRRWLATVADWLEARGY